MPTEYTANVVSGKISTLSEFAMICAREFGALIGMRDLPLSAPVPESVCVDPYYEECLKEAQCALAEWERKPEISWLEWALVEKDKRIRNAEAELSKIREQSKRIAKMISSVNEWNEPTDEHIRLKSFMLEQLNETSRFDCDDSYICNELEKLMSETAVFIAYKNHERLKLAVTNASKMLAAETKRTAHRNSWMSALRDSLVGK